MTVHDIPALNATLNAIATVLITLGYVFHPDRPDPGAPPGDDRRDGRVGGFPRGYVTHKILIRGVHTPFGGEGLIRTVYYTMLISHIILAMSIAYLVPRTFLSPCRAIFVTHQRWAKWVFPIWYYVSVTGVLVYFFLYQWWPAAR